MEEKTNKFRKRLIININEELHEEISQRAAARYMTITCYVLQALIEKIIKEKKYE